MQTHTQVLSWFAILSHWIFHFPTKPPLLHSHFQANLLILTTIRVNSSHLLTTQSVWSHPCSPPIFPIALNKVPACFFWTNEPVAEPPIPSLFPQRLPWRHPIWTFTLPALTIKFCFNQVSVCVCVCMLQLGPPVHLTYTHPDPIKPCCKTCNPVTDGIKSIVGLPVHVCGVWLMAAASAHSCHHPGSKGTFHQMRRVPLPCHLWAPTSSLFGCVSCVMLNPCSYGLNYLEEIFWQKWDRLPFYVFCVLVMTFFFSVKDIWNVISIYCMKTVGLYLKRLLCAVAATVQRAEKAEI